MLVSRTVCAWDLPGIFVRFLSAINTPFCFPGVRSGGVRMLVFCFLPLFYYRGISSTPELLEAVLRPRTALYCELM